VAEIRLADISEWQPSIDAPAYLAGGHKCLIVRAHSGGRVDNFWPTRRDYLRQYPFAALGWYQYLAGGRDAAQQAHEFVNCVGGIRANEFVVLDSEEGAGSQVARCQAWFDVVDRAYGVPSVLYASESWFSDRLGGAARWSGRARWVAAYRSSEPTMPHELWQHSSTASFPGIAGGIDSSVFHGTEAQFLAAMRHGDVQQPPPPEDYMAITSGQTQDGKLHVFVEAKDGSIWYTWQPQPGNWHGGEKGKQIAGLVKFAPAPK
jgi:GH25 family lysozyme M1 (1,4-beta-N-acetylmuramidase)